jgi:SAM-dependent methyltransferase
VQVPFSARVWYAVRAATARGSMSPGWYEDNAASVVPVYEAIDPAALHGWLPDLLPATILDVGAGSGRDAAWLSRFGWAGQRMRRVIPCADLGRGTGHGRQVARGCG